jgi:hypothetical protein
MKSRPHTQFVRGACSVLVATGCFSCESTPKPSEAAVPRAKAEATALARVKGGKITEGELEKEDGKLVWSFDISQPGTKDIKEIQVDAKTGAIVSEETESAEDEAAEKAKEAKEKKS